ncbi:uncharacterized protein BX664DRAFT_302546 [Halteromyces radiatus]|uniref:uncharacterized protein n=1 Tax=Halteromyces radiatus TaxID=101107 RepID=UPI002220BA66|nr:uncharacterized protein BX664DRAFT_302546 [Halteromyces radiatus]KAI8081676.1 hypothetical protein BX664DRAFT_302546 [Halteromyces radiatus]
MSTTFSRSDPVPIPNANNTVSFSYKEIVRNLTANAPQPYGAIPPLMKKKRKQKKKSQVQRQQQQALRRMSHVENWVAVDSKESLPDEEELIHSPFQNFLSVDFLTGILPLHMPPPSLSDPMTLLHQEEIAKFTYHHQDVSTRFEDIDNGSIDDDEDEDDDDDDDDDEDDDESDFSPPTTSSSLRSAELVKRSIPSFTKSNTPSTSTTTSYAMSSSPPDQDRQKWIDTIEKLRQSLASSSQPAPSRRNGFIPMPLPPRRKRSSRKRRSEATTQPRFNFDTNTYTRDTRSNPDHLRMIAAELNMMRSRKLFSPLKPRGFLPRRKDPFILGDGRLRSPLRFEIV